MISEIRSGEMSPGEEWEYAHDLMRDGLKDDWRLGLIDLEGPPDQEVDLEGEEDLRRNLEQAQNRIGVSDDERVRWLLRFAALDFADRSTADLQWDVLAFTVPASARSVPYELYVGTGRIKVPVSELYRWVRSGFDALKNSVEGHHPSWRVDVLVSHDFTWRSRRIVDQGSEDDSSPTGSRFKARVCEILVSWGHRIRLCQNCDQIFLGRKRQAYCTPKCSQIRRTTEYRAKHPERIKELRRAAHVRKQQRRIGRRVKVERRPRKAKARPLPAQQGKA